MKKPALYTILLGVNAFFAVSCNDHMIDDNRIEGIPEMSCMYNYVNDTDSDCIVTWSYPGYEQQISKEESIPAHTHYSEYGMPGNPSFLYCALTASFIFADGKECHIERTIKSESGLLWWDVLPNTVYEMLTHTSPIYEVKYFLLSDVIATAHE